MIDIEKNQYLNKNFKTAQNTFCGPVFFQVNLWPMLFSKLASHKILNKILHKSNGP